MAKVFITIKIMLESPNTNIDSVKSEVKKEISNFGGSIHKTEIEPVAFGLKALKVSFVMDESKGAVDPLEKNLNKIKGIKSAETTDVRRMFG